MSDQYQPQKGNEELWKMLFAAGDPRLQKMQNFHMKLPTKPRCRLCLAPFKGIGGWIMRLKGKSRNNRNPNFCNACDKFLETFPGGADIELSILFVDIRRSTEYTETHDPAAVSRRINIFLNEAINTITDNDGFINAFYGDCVVAAWPPGFSGKDHAAKALATARQLVAKDMRDSSGEAIPVGVGVHTGPVFISTVSALQGTFRDISIFGNNVNLTSRLASLAKPMQALSTRETIEAAGQDPASYRFQSVELKGFSDPVDAYEIA